MEDLNELLKKIDDMLSSNKQTVQQEQQPVQEQTVQIEEPVTEEDEQQFLTRLGYYRDIGLSKFIAANSQMKDFEKLLPTIVSYADYYLQQDLMKGTPKDSYTEYLELGKQQVITELASLTKSILSQPQQPQQHQVPQGKQPSYFMKDYYNDYKKMLIETTVEDTPVEFRDGYITDNGTVISIESGKLPIYQKPNLKNL